MIVTFYSYKGGVGRSFCLANVAVQLARWGNRVLCVDFDLDAPGLHEYFAPYSGGSATGGVVEMISEGVGSGNLVEELTVPDAEGLFLLTAGAMDSSYADRAQTLSWQDLFENHDLGWRFEEIRKEWEQDYDYVLIDSRTGITDIGGICTAQLPDLLVLCVAPNRQNLAGALDVAQRAAQARDRLPYDRDGLLYLPVVSRFDGREEYERARSWRTTMAEQFAPLYASWLPADQEDGRLELGLVERTTVPYLPYWSFGEEIAVVDERSGSPDSVSYYMDNIAALIAHRLADADVLVGNRDTYVSAARERGRRDREHGFRSDVLVHGTSERAAELTDELQDFGVRAVRGRLVELLNVRNFVVVDPPELPSAGVQEIIDQVQLDPGRLVMVVGKASKQLSSAFPITATGTTREIAIEVVSAMSAQDAGPHWEGVLVSAARALQYRGRLAESHALAVRALETTPKPTRSLLLLGELAKDLGWFAEAQANLHQVLSMAPNSFIAQQAHRLLGELYRYRGDMDQAVLHFQEALVVGDNQREQALVHRELVGIELGAGNPTEALRHLETARELSEGDVVLEAELAYELGSMLLDRGDVDAAERQLADAVEKNALPNDDQVTALRQLAYLESTAGRHDGAEEYLRRARDLAVRPEDKVDIIIELARLRRDVSGLDEALGALGGTVLKLDPVDLIGRSRLLETMGDFQLDARQHQAAQDSFERALVAFQRLGDRQGELRALIGLTAALRDRDDARALQTWNAARRLLARLRGPEADLLRRQLDAVEPK